MAYVKVEITVKARSDYDAVFNAITGDSKHTMECDSYNWTFNGTMTQRDYNDLYTAITTRMPHYPICITSDYKTTIVSYDYDQDDNDYITINGERAN